MSWKAKVKALENQAKTFGKNVAADINNFAAVAQVRNDLNNTYGNLKNTAINTAAVTANNLKDQFNQGVTTAAYQVNQGVATMSQQYAQYPPPGPTRSMGGKQKRRKKSGGCELCGCGCKEGQCNATCGCGGDCGAHSQGDVSVNGGKSKRRSKSRKSKSRSRKSTSKARKSKSRSKSRKRK